MTRIQRIWQRLIERCDRENIPLHPAWRDKDEFLRTFGGAPPGHWLVRKDKAVGYVPGNCVWATPGQSAAMRTSRKTVESSLRQRALKAGLSYDAVRHRIRGGWAIELALAHPPRTTLRKAMGDE